MPKHYRIECMTREEVDLAIEWAANEGWNPGLHDADYFYQTDPSGFFAGKLDGKIIAVGSAVRYDEFFAFCGLYIVDEQYRGQHYGLKLTQKRLAYIGSRNAGIDGVMTMLDKYVQLGYTFAHSNARYSGKAIKASSNSPAILPLTKKHFASLVDYDSQHFPAPRAHFLKYWINQPEGASLGYFQDKQLCGYGVLRACRVGFKIGPLFANNEKIADELFLALVNHAPKGPIFLDIPENNSRALALVKRYQLVKVFETARMYLKGQPALPIEQIYGITTFELG